MLLCFIPVHVRHAATCNLFGHQDQCNAINLSNINLQNSKTIFRCTLKENNIFLLSKNMMHHCSTTDSKILFLFNLQLAIVDFCRIGHYSSTDSTILFLFREVPIVQCLFFSLEKPDLFLSKICFLCLYLTLAVDKFLDIHLFQRELRSRRLLLCFYGIRRLSWCVARHKRLQRTHMKVFLLTLLVLSGDVHSNPGPTTNNRRTHPLVTATWNVRTLLDSKRAHARPSAIVARELDRYGIDIAALSETRVFGETSFEENPGKAGYTFFLKGKPEGDKHYHGVGFAIRSNFVPLLKSKYPTGINERLMTMCLPLDSCNLTLISAYAPLLQH